MRSSAIVFAAVISMLLLATCTQALATTYYVAPTGSDTNDGLLSSTAFLTVKKAATVVSSGDTVYVAPGTYTDAIEVVDVSQSIASVRFIAQNTSGDVIISDAQLRVVKSNYVEFHGFKFQSNTAHFVVWTGSYEGRLEGCVFVAGSEPLLIKDGSLTLENCSLTDFVGDGIRVDGEAKVFLNSSTISGCGGEGVEVSAPARVFLNGTTIQNNSGDGIKVDHSQGSVDDGGSGGGGAGGKGLVAGLDGITASAGIFDTYDSVNDTGSGAGDPASMGQTKLYSNGLIQVTNNVPVRGDVWLGATGTAAIDNLSGTINTGSTNYSLAPIDPGDAATVNDNGSIPLTYKGKNAIDGSGRLVLAASKGKGSEGVNIPPGTYYFTGISISGGSMARVTGPTTIYVNGPVDLTGGYFFNATPYAANLKILVLSSDLVNLSAFDVVRAAIYAPYATVGYYAYTGSGKNPDQFGIRGMVAAKRIEVTIAGIRADLALADYAGEITGLAVAAPSTPTTPPTGWQTITSTELDISNSTITNNQSAIELVTPSTFAARFTEFSNNSEWGLRLNGPFKLDTCTIKNNAIGGLWMKDVADGEFGYVSLTIGSNSQYGIFLENCQVTFNNTMLSQNTISGSEKSVTSQGGSLTLDGVTLSGGSVAGVFATAGTLSVKNSTLTGNGYGIAAHQCSVTVDNSTLSQNAVGLYAFQNDLLKVTNTTISNNSSWGAAVYASSTAGAKATFLGCTIASNIGGLTIVDAADGDFQLLDTVVRDNTQKGLHFQACNLTLANQATDNWRTLRNGQGISSDGSTLTLDKVAVEQSSGYAISSDRSDLIVRKCQLTGRDGIYVSGDTSKTTVDSSQLTSTATGVTNWGVYRIDGDLRIVNSVVYGFQNGVYLASSTSAPADMFNTTIVNVSHYGVYLADAPAQLINNVVVGNSAQYGIVKGSGALTHSNNLLHGFNMPFYGTVADATEILRDPRFVDVAGGDYHLGVGSPAINVGLDLGVNVATDMEGNARPAYQAFDLGAYEFTQKNGSYRVLDWKEKR